MTQQEDDGYLQFHNLLHVLAQQQFLSPEAVDDLRKFVAAECISPVIKAAIIQIIDEIERNGLDGEHA